jgi:uncharacterized Zn-finger protein
MKSDRKRKTILPSNSRSYDTKITRNPHFGFVNTKQFARKAHKYGHPSQHLQKKLTKRKTNPLVMQTEQCFL